MLAVAEMEQLPVAEARAGNSEAWDTLFRRYQLPLYVYVYELVHEEQSSLDLVQETFVNAARYLHTLRDDAKFGSWLFGIAHQKVAQFWRRPAPELISEEALVAIPDEAFPGPDQLLIRREQESEFMALLQELPAPQRSVLLLHYLEDFSLEEIAQLTSTSLGTVKSRIYYARKTMRHLIRTAS